MAETNLNIWRRARGLTQRELATKAGLSVRTLQHYEQGSLDINAAAALTVYRLAQALGVPMFKLLELPTPEPASDDIPL